VFLFSEDGLMVHGGLLHKSTHLKINLCFKNASKLFLSTADQRYSWGGKNSIFTPQNLIPSSQLSFHL